MTKVLPATCEAGVVKAEGVAIPSATVLSEGVAKSEGLLIMEEDKQTYITSSASDIKETLTNLVSALEKIESCLQSIDTKGFLVGATAGVPATPFLTSEIAAINSAKNTLNTLKGNLK